MKDRLFYLVDTNVAVPLRNPFKIQKKFVETTNFVPELLPDHESVLMNPTGIAKKGETWMPELEFLMENDSISRMKSPFSPSESFLRLMDEDDKDEEWDDDEEDVDDDDDDEEWDDDDDEDWDEDEDWDDEEDADDEDDEEWEEEEDEAE